jgi:molybdopterin converting factor small subunit
MLRTKGDEFEFREGAILADVLAKTAKIYGARFQKEVFEPGDKDVKTGFAVTVNGVLTGQLRGVNTPLKEGDNIILMTLPSGG